MNEAPPRVKRNMVARHPAVLVSASLLLVALAVAAVPSARATARHLITGRDIQNGSITTSDLENGLVNSHKILDGHVLPRDLSDGLRAQIARHATNGKPGADGKDGTPGPQGRDGTSVTSAVIPAADSRCANGAGGVAYTLGSQTISVCNGKDGQPGVDTAVQLTDVGQDWTSHASATRDANGWVHLSGYLSCLAPVPDNCANDALTLPAGFESDSAKEVFPLMTEQEFGGSSSYDQAGGAIELRPGTVTVPDADTGAFNGLNVWLSGITYKAG
jgi:hypothetical protein